MKGALTSFEYNSKKILDSVNDIEAKLSTQFDSSKPLLGQLEEYIMEKREANPKFLIESNLEYTDYELALHPVFSINLFRLLEIFFDNIFKHADANKINFDLSLSQNVIEVLISDNGVGIDSDYLTKSPWYSSLHKAHETIYLLNGNLNITKGEDKGTTVKFRFPIQN